MSPEMTSITPKAFRRSVCGTTELSKAPQTEPAIPAAAITRTAVPNICLRERCTQTELPAEKRKKSRFIPCAVICGISVKSARKTTKSPPPPTPSPERAAIKKDAIIVNTKAITPVFYFIIKTIPEYITSAANSFRRTVSLILPSSIPPTMPPIIAGIAYTPIPDTVRFPAMA